MQDMLVSLALASMNTLMDTSKNLRQFVQFCISKHNLNVPPCLLEQFHMLTKC